MNDKQIINYIKGKLSHEKKINENLVLGRSWAKSGVFVNKIQSIVSTYNFNNIMMHLRGYDLSQDKIIEDIDFNGTFNTSRLIEKKLLVDLAQFMNIRFNPLSGYFTTGGTEANIYALWIARNWSRSTESKAKTTWIIPKSAHYSIDKALNILDIYNSCCDEVYIVGNDLGELRANEVTNLIKEKRQVDDSPIVIVLTAVSTELGLIDPIGETVEFIKNNSYKNIFLHIDACFSGLILPVLDGYESFFAHNEISTIAVDFHKTFGAPMGSGALLINNNYHTYSAVGAAYLAHDDFTLLGSRSGNNAIVTWALFEKEVKTNIWAAKVAKSIRLTQFLHAELTRVPFVDILYKPFVNYLIFKIINLNKEDEIQVDKILSQYSISATNYNGQKLYKIILTDTVKKRTLNSLINELRKLGDKR